MICQSYHFPSYILKYQRISLPTKQYPIILSHMKLAGGGSADFSDLLPREPWACTVTGISAARQNAVPHYESMQKGSEFEQVQPISTTIISPKEIRPTPASQFTQLKSQEKNGDTGRPTFPQQDRQENQPAALRMWKYYERLQLSATCLAP